MPLPTLQTYPGIVTPQPGNALMQAQKIQSGQMQNQLMGKKLEDYDEDRAYLKKSRSREDKKFEMETEEYNYKKLQRHAKKAKEFLPQVTPENYDDYVKWNVESGVPAEFFKSPEEFAAMTVDEQEAYKLQLAKGADDLVATDLETQKSRAKATEQKQKDAAAMERAKLAADARIKAANISASKKSDGKDYEGDRAKLVDDTRSYYHEKGRHLLDPESGLIQMGPKDNPDKYVKEFKEILSEMQKDMKRISNGELPSWYKQGAKTQMDDSEVSNILTDNGYDPTPENIEKFRKNNDL